MDFGRVTKEELATIDLALPPEPATNAAVLATGHGRTRFHIGCSRWGRKDWIGKLYPQGTKEKHFLHEYSKQFNSLELNATFYKSPDKAQVQQWKDNAAADFLFCPKFPQIITHLKRLNGTNAEVDRFLTAIYEFGHKLGPIFLMPNPQMGLKQLPVLKQFIEDFPRDVSMFTELRNPEFYVDGYNKELLDFLIQQKRGTIITDAAGRRDVLHMHLSTPQAFIRFMGNGLERSDYERIDQWVERIVLWKEQGLEQLYFFVHQHEELDAPTLISYMIKELNDKCNAGIRLPVWQ